MEAKDLMVGDWVRIIDDDTDACFDARVEVIDMAGNVYVKAPGDETAYPYSVDCVKPIPITPEILEKNGFIVKHPESAKRTYWRDCAGQIIGHKNRGLMYMEISGNPVKFGYFLPHFSGHIQFVHELQHAIRLCGIDKTIEL